MRKKVLVIGSGGREHALVRVLSESSRVSSIICSPGNAGTAMIPGCRNLTADGNKAIVSLARNESVDLVVPGPEAPLAAGLVDELAAAGITAFGPKASSARLESSKGFAKDFMARNGVATAAYARYANPDEAKAEIDRFGFPVVVKADGLAAGKGVLICADRSEAEAAVDSVMVRRDFGDAGAQIVLEECLNGWETSIIGLIDGKTFLPFLPAKDHKRAGNGDTGPNTGGMGVIAPHPLVNEDVTADIEKNIIIPTMEGLEKDGLGYSGFLFIGVMVTGSGAKVLEYNVRLGDPEAQALLPLFDGDFLIPIESALSGRLEEIRPGWRGGASCCIVVASGGYPGSYQTGFAISGMDEAENEGALVYCAGVQSDHKGTLLSSGGRVLGVTSLGKTLDEAGKAAYEAVEKIRFEGSWYRSDIGTA